VHTDVCTCVDVCMHVYMRGYEEVVGGGGGDMCGVRCVYNYKCFYFLLVYTVFLFFFKTPSRCLSCSCVGHAVLKNS
jgi:hypothetical protein